jgi:hypothetical protein
MKRIRNKQVLIKRIRLEEKEYDFIINDKKTANTVVESTKGKTTGMIFVKANLYESFTFAVRRFFK